MVNLCSISSVMISRLMLNLRHPSLGNGLFIASTGEKTYPNLTFVEPEYPSHIEGTPSWRFDPLQDGCAREMYHYLERGTSRSRSLTFLFLRFANYLHYPSETQGIGERRADDQHPV